MQTTTATWWHTLYDDYIADILLERESPEEVRATLDFLVRKLRLESGSAVFDQCCGIGSLALPLCERGYHVIGVDQSAGYIEKARRAAPPAARFFAGDASRFVPPRLCDAAFNWWTSFGYAPTDEENIRMLERAYESLLPGGRFALDTMNVPGVLRNFRPREITERETPRGTLRLIRESRIDVERGMLHKTWTFFPPDGTPLSRPSSVRTYMPDRLVELLSRVGFMEVELYGSVAGEPLTLDSPRCICVCRKIL